jgi:GNAT superfamily N-acetyltransferase
MPADSAPAFVLRHHCPGDMGWIISRHAKIYVQDYGWDGSFEALVAEIAAEFVRRHDPARERAFLAVRARPDGTEERLGSCLVVDAGKNDEGEPVAKLRLVLVEPSARGLGLGKALVRAAIQFAREKGYSRMTLWTNDILHAARAIYVAEGFSLVAEERHHSFGKDLVGQNWELVL